MNTILANYLNFMSIIPLILITLSGCQPRSQSATSIFKKSIVNSKIYVTDFGWNTIDQVYYAIPANGDSENEESKTLWYAFNEGSNASEELASPAHFTLDNSELSSLEH